MAAENIKAEIFGDDGSTEPDFNPAVPTSGYTQDLPDGDDFSDFSDFEVHLDDDDLDAARSRYKPIPANTRLNLVIDAVERRMTKSGKRKLTLDLSVEGDQWGKNRTLRFKDIIFDPEPDYQWRWGQFLKAAGWVANADEITPERIAALFADPDQIKGRRLSARVIGHSWKQRPGTMDPDFPRSYGKNARPVPDDGTDVFEDLSDWAPPVEPDDNPQDMRGLAEFVANAQSLDTYTS